MSRPPRIPGFDYLGPHCYFATFCTFQRRATFGNARAARLTLMQFRRTARAEGFALLAYCLMPDHAHLLVQGTTATCDFRKFVKRAKQATGQFYAHRIGGPLWQEGFHERVLRRDTDLREVARYIVWNPVRAGLTSTPGEYPYLGSGLLSLDDLCA